MPKVLVTGSAGFIGTYLVNELLANDYDVVGLDNFSKYGELNDHRTDQERYRFVRGDAKDTELLKELLADCDHFIAGAAMIGGISYFHKYAYDLLAENERIAGAAFDAAIWAHKNAKLQKITVVSSSMVFENTSTYPTPEGDQRSSPPPTSTYGFQKLAMEYYAQGAYEQYQLPYTIVRPFNCVGIGERKAKSGEDLMSGDIKLALSHVVPDVIQKILKGQDPLRIFGSGAQIRHYTYGGDLARGIRVCVEHPKALNDDFNLSTAVSTSVLELAKLIWSKIKVGEEFRCMSEDPFPHDVQRRVPNVEKAKNLLGFEATTDLSEVLDEVIPWIKEQIGQGNI
jgi:UDP-glucose 4-epimerase